MHSQLNALRRNRETKHKPCFRDDRGAAIFKLSSSFATFRTQRTTSVPESFFFFFLSLIILVDFLNILFFFTTPGMIIATEYEGQSIILLFPTRLLLEKHLNILPTSPPLLLTTSTERKDYEMEMVGRSHFQVWIPNTTLEEKPPKKQEEPSNSRYRSRELTLAGGWFSPEAGHPNPLCSPHRTGGRGSFWKSTWRAQPRTLLSCAGEC